MDKLQAAEQLRRALQMFAATLTEEQTLEIATVYPAWQTGWVYSVGDVISYGTNNLGDPQLYKVVQAHTSQADWTPDATPALYDAFGLDESGYPLWAQPSGAHDAYNQGDIVNYNGDLYGQTVQVELVRYLRTEQKFSSIGALREQLDHDKSSIL